MSVGIPRLGDHEVGGMGQAIIQIKELEIDRQRYNEYKAWISKPRLRRGAWRIRQGVMFREVVDN